MKIKKLVITGFGPYATRQELDFEKNLQDKNMFVITGNTGAGKTTIFDAINFALYGEASGSDREGKSFRSDFADSKTQTEVELWFSLRGREYCVKRTPAYMKPKQRGEGFVESKPTAELILSKDKTVTGTKEVTKEIENILGITTEQFKQLVMIPQGEFKKLLNARSEEKEDIFRKIFGTQIFESIQKQIKEESNQLKNTIEQVRRDRLHKIKSFNCKDKDEELFKAINADEININLIMKKFYEFIEGDKEEQKKLEAIIEEQSIKVDSISKEITLGEAINKKFDNLQKNKEELDKLKERSTEIEGKKLKVERGKKALRAKAYEEKYEEKKGRVNELNLQIKTIRENLEKYEQSYREAEKKFSEQKGREEEKNKLNQAIEEIKRLRGKASAYEINKKNVEILERRVKAIEARIREIGAITLENDKKAEIIKSQLEEIKKAKEQKRILEINEINYNNKKEKLSKLRSDVDSWLENKERHRRFEQEFNSFELSYKELQKTYDFLEDSFRKNQAGILANNLQEGEPCPVCGSTHHPSLAKLENNEITEEAVKLSKEKLEKVKVEREKKLNTLTDINASLNSIKNNSIDPVVKELLGIDRVVEVRSISEEVNGLIKSNNTLLAEVKSKIQSLNSVINKENEKLKAQEELEKSNKDLRGELQLKNEELVVEEGKLSAAQNTLDSIKSEFKGEIKTLSELDARDKVLNNQLQALKNAYEASEREFNKIKGQLDEESGKYKNAAAAKEKLDVELAEAIRVFKEGVLDLGFVDYKDYKASCLTEKELETIEKQINDFNISLEGARKLYEASLKETEGLSKVDLALLNQTLTTEKINLNVLNDKKMDIVLRISNNNSVVKACEIYNSEIEEEEKRYEVIGKLSKITNGDNPKKISFERYVLAAYFEDIIEAANIRFNKMTLGRFELLRKQDLGDKRKGQGLDLEVFDNYTGKARDIKTLSGGESFKASLAMALGLADVVQAYAGGIQLDTMFIDEGFGTLDPESLDNAIECLMDLQNDGRLVGIISHVPELKERIGARLEVSATNKGSVAQFRI